MNHSPRPSPSRKRVAVIGAGPGGLATAMLLARAGCEVTVHERAPHVGGRSARIQAPTPHGNFHFDTGPTFFLYPRILADIFTQCGLRLEDEIDLIRLDPHYRLMFENGGELCATPDLARLQAEIARINPHDALAVEHFMRDNRAKLAAFRPVLESPFNSARDLLRPSMLRALKWLRPHHSVDQDLARYFSDPRVRLAFTFQSKYLGMSPFRCPSLFTILSFLEYEYGVFHPRGGCGAVLEAMARCAQNLGARIQLNDPVQHILFEGRRAVGVRTAAGDQRVDAVVVNADFAQAMRSLVPDTLRRRWRNRTLARKKYSCSTFMMYLGLEGTQPDVAHHTIYLSEDYRRNLAQIEQGRLIPDNPSVYVQNACVSDPSLAPQGHSTLYVLVPVGHTRDQGGIDWATQAPHLRRMAMERLERIGIPQVERRIRFEKILTPQNWEQDMAIYRGATFNLAHTLDQMLHRRPHNRFEDLHGVYLVGGGTHPGSGLPVIFEGARITARLMSEDLDLPLPNSTLWPQAASHAAPLSPFSIEAP